MLAARDGLHQIADYDAGRRAQALRVFSVSHGGGWGRYVGSPRPKAGFEASVTASAPEPVPTSRMERAARCHAQRRLPHHVCSVSGAGIKTSGVDANSRP